MFQIIPAIDLMEGSCVRLQQGDASRKTRYPEPPDLVAHGYETDGAKRIHVVDLDGAFSGQPCNTEAIRSIRAAVKADIEVGGGIRDRSSVETLLGIGVNYVVIGTKALEDPVFLEEMVRDYGERIIVGADARNGMLSTRGWTETTAVAAIPYLRELRDRTGVSTVIFTDIARDGMFTSPNYAILEQALMIEELEIIASGGVGSVDDVRALRALNKPNLLGVIVGKALYDGRVVLREAIHAASQPSGGAAA